MSDDYYMYQRGGRKYITYFGNKYVARKFKRVFCWMFGHFAIHPEGEGNNICVRCGKRNV